MKMIFRSFSFLACFLALTSPTKLTSAAEVKPTAKLKAAPSKTTKAAPPKKLPQLLEEVEAKYAKAQTLQADFTQVNLVAALKTKKTTTGLILVKRPNKLRWETHAPESNILVSDGRKFWFYTPPFDETEHGQYIEKPASSMQTKLANALLSGSFSVARDMKITIEGASRFILTPKPGTAGTVQRAEIEIDPTLKLIRKVTLQHKGGNHAEISLDKIELGKPMGDELFVFIPPPGTERVSD